MKRRAFIGLFSGAVLNAGCSIISAGGPRFPRAPSLFQKFSGNFLVGAAANSRTIVSHKDLLLSHFNSLTPENELKFELLRPDKRSFDFTRSDKVINFAVENNLAVRGHCLVWHRQNPDWLFKDNGRAVKKEKLEARLRDHIAQVVGRYKCNVFCWDVVNEAITNGAGFYRETPWLKILGAEYIEQAFKAAHLADPSAKLFYNDHRELDPEKKGKIIKLIKKLKARNVPVHGLGLQCHWDTASFNPEDLTQALNDYCELGLEIHITELDVALKTPPNNKSSDLNELIDKQEAIYSFAFSTFKRYSQIKSVTLWGISDETSWRYRPEPGSGFNTDPLLFDSTKHPKRALFKLIDA